MEKISMNCKIIGENPYKIYLIFSLNLEKKPSKWNYPSCSRIKLLALARPLTRTHYRGKEDALTRVTKYI